MTEINSIRGRLRAHALANALLWIAVASGVQAQPDDTQTLDRVVATVNNRAILASDVADELRLSVLDPNVSGTVLTPSGALQQLISRELIQEQIREEDEEAAQPSTEEVQARLTELRRELPNCVHENCATDSGWAAFLKKNSLTKARMETYVRRRLEVLRFIEIRFRQGIRIPPQDVETYYSKTLLPQYKPGERIPSLSDVSSRIEEILLQQQVNSLFGAWLDNLRKQGDVEVLDPSLEVASTPAAATVNE